MRASASSRTGSEPGSSESDTLIPSSPPPTDDRQHDNGIYVEKSSDIDEPDRPVKFRSFLLHVKATKALLVLCIPACIAFEVLHLFFWIQAHWTPAGKIDKVANLAVLITDAIGVGMVSIVGLLFLVTLLLPIRPPTATGPPKRLRLHRTFCKVLFVFVSTPLILHPMVGVLYTIYTHRSIPSLGPWYTEHARTIALVVTLFVGGCMRRGPKLHYQQLILMTGFGVNAEPATEKGIKPAPEMNVLDWSNCSLMAFIGLFYIWPLAKRSMQVVQLSRTDLPHLEQYVRQSGFSYMMWNVDSKEGQVKLGDGPVKKAPPPKWTEWTLLKATWSGRGSVIFSSLILDGIRTAFSYVQIASMHEIINTFQEPAGSDKSYARLMCWGLFLGQTIEVLLGSYLWVRENYLLHLPTRMTLASILFSKILRTADAAVVETHLASEEDREDGKGRSQVMNLLTIDNNTIASIATIAPNVTNSAISLLIGVAFLYQMLGVSAFVGIACVPLSSPLSTYVAKNIYHCDKAWARHRDARTAAIKEFLLGVKVIKLNAFEDYFRRNIQRLRDIEVVSQRWRFTLGTLFNILADQMPIAAILITFFFHTKVLHKPLEPATAFVALGVFNRVKDSLTSLPSAVNELLSTWVALQRLVTYLNQTEIEDADWDTTDQQIVLEKATIAWPSGDTKEDAESGINTFKLRNVSLRLPVNQFTLVCGPLGSGKSLFLRALLGEAHIESGLVQTPRSALSNIPVQPTTTRTSWTTETWLNDSIAYAPQQSYIQHGTVRDNILFGQPFWEERYRETLRQAALLSDLTIMQDGDMTEVGSKGANLSGGQRARVNLARCLYSRAKTIYMDDILSAVDAHTSRFLVQECLGGKLLKGRTVVLVTHHVGLCLPVADFVVSLNNGTVDQSGTVSEVKMDVIAAQLPPQEEDEEDEEPDVKFREGEEDEENKKKNADKSTTRQIYKTEAMATGSVTWDHYLFVLKAAGGKWYWLTLIILYFFVRGMDVAQAQWLKIWSSDPDPSHLDLNLGVYAILVSSGVMTGAIRWVWLYGVGNIGFYNRGSRLIHRQALDSICDAPLSFFESTPSGRLLNIFGRDMQMLDGWSADALGRTLSSTLDVTSSAIIICLQAPSLLIFMILFTIPLYWMSKVLRKLRADLRRLSATAASPLISLYNDTIEGVVMVRAFGSAQYMCAAMVALINREREVTLADYTIFNWVRAVIRSVASIIVTATGFYLINQEVSAAQAGYVLSFAVATSQGLYILLETYSSLEQAFVSAERVNHYIQTTPAESKAGDVPPPSWPDKGAISIEKLCVTYAPELPDVLHDVSIKIEPGMRVGIVGSTGSGKSTLALALFRAMEAKSGRIAIDGRDIGKMPVQQLRKRINMVVQDGSLNSGTLRDALDLTQSRDDFEIYEALRRVHLLPDSLDPSDLADNQFANLDTFVAVEGNNFSQGQRQLLCLARALLKQSKVLVMDEATSSVDFDMDEKITKTLKESFAATTIITIAHRLATIMQYDRVLVLDRGTVLEYGRPADLVKDGASAFRALCMAQGKDEFDKLVAMTK
ncbi:hypothetical protein BD324DRAFT_607321 [Kockovaella imperatae]|uniref:P-loop containing nucleoside triphosphate hydrolase protein n=1 Tax=Kockovaella imperatae TaxID=4999 RepID=A0A1Y1UQG6_9TREE|nr:hypothetical protein BD324DRAFT_607321 [Kockovaella imperatae]ORX40310.1 hypothetical protein BD324DRAFT_607321 [Kockovaella imperatae]